MGGGGRPTTWLKVASAAMAATIPATIGTPLVSRHNAALLGLPHHPLALVWSSCTCVALLFPRVLPHLPLSSDVTASGGGEGEEGGGGAAEAAATVVTVTAIVISIGDPFITFGIGIVFIIRVITNMGSDGDVAIIARCDVGRDPPPLFALSFTQVFCIHACWQKALLGGGPSPPLLSLITSGVRRRLLGGNAADAESTETGGGWREGRGV